MLFLVCYTSVETLAKCLNIKADLSKCTIQLRNQQQLNEFAAISHL